MWPFNKRLPVLNDAAGVVSFANILIPPTVPLVLPMSVWSVSEVPKNNLAFGLIDKLSAASSVVIVLLPSKLKFVAVLKLTVTGLPIPNCLGSLFIPDATFLPIKSSTSFFGTSFSTILSSPFITAAIHSWIKTKLSSVSFCFWL